MTRKQKEFQKHIDSWNASNLSQAEYCRRHKLDIKQFGYYMRRLRSSSTNDTFAEVVIPGQSNLQLTFPGGITVHLDRNFDENLLKKVCEVLRCSH